jgi:uncharacterized protein (DUF2147 family)
MHQRANHFLETSMKKLLIAGAMFFSAIGCAQAAEVYGVWKRPEDGITFNFRKCGESLCVTVRSVVDAADKKYVGRTVFSGAQKISDNVWQGRVHNLEDGQNYLGKITLTGSSTVRLDGCVLGGAICKGETWTRAR